MYLVLTTKDVVFCHHLVLALSLGVIRNRKEDCQHNPQCPQEGQDVLTPSQNSHQLLPNAS